MSIAGGSRQGITRRRALEVSGLFAAGTMASFPTPGITQARRKVTLVYGVQAMEANVSFISSIPLGAGFFAEEGLDVEVLTANGASLAANMVSTGQAQFTTHSNGALFSGLAQGVPFKAFMCQVPDNFFSLAVEQDSPVKSVADLKGGAVGVPSLGGGTFLMMKAVARAAGLSEENNEIEYLAVGGGLPALDALKRNRVRALFLWDTPYSLFEADGVKLRYMSPEPLPRLGFTHITTASLDTIEKAPDLVAAMGRALSKSIVFMAAANPEEVAKLHFKLYPAAKPISQSDDEAIRVEKVRLKTRIGFMRTRQRVFSRDELLGDDTDERVLGVRDLLFNGGEIKQKLPLDSYFTRKFLPEINNINVAEVIAKAKAFRA